MNNKRPFRTLPAVLAGGCLVLVGNVALAAPVIVGFSPAVSVMDSLAAGATANTFTSSPISFSQFNSGLGVLIGATLTQAGSIFLQDSLAASGVTGQGEGNAKADASASVTAASFTLDGVANAFLSSANSLSTPTASCNSKSSCTASRTASASFTSSVALSDLAALVGNGTVTGTASVSLSTSVTNSSGTARNFSSATSTATATTTFTTNSLDYTYLPHSNASFGSGADINSLSFDFGNVLQGSSASHAFELFNLMEGSIGLDLVSVTASGGSGFSVQGDLFQNLAFGSSATETLVFDTGAVGAYRETFRLAFRDAAATAGAGKLENTLDLTVTGSVLAVAAMDQQSSVPVDEPNAVSLLLIGLGLMYAASLRRWHGP